jgi:hypothetical protein
MLPTPAASARRVAPRAAEWHSREASTAFSEACTAFLRIMSRIVAAFEHFRRTALRSAPSSSRCQRDMSLRISLTLHFRSPDAQVPAQWP